MEGITGKTALVTGGTGGIGAAIARAFAAGGARAIAAGLPEEAARAPAPDELEGIDVRELDVTHAASIEALLGSIERIDFLVNAAGVNLREAEFEPETFARVIAVNLEGAARMCLAARSKFPGADGAIVNLASMYSFFGAGHAPAYAASKGGLVQLTKSLAIAWARHGIRVNAVAPGWIRTAMTRTARETPAIAERVLGRTPLGRWGEPADVAGPVLFLCSAAAGFITGAVLTVDGGYSIT